MNESALVILYISYDGMTDPLGGSQVLPYLAGLARLGHRIILLSFEKPERTAEEVQTIKAFCETFGIIWIPKRYHRRPPIVSTVFDLFQMWRTARRLQIQFELRLVHCRSYIPAIVGLWLKRKFKIPFLFDMRGFWADERVEGGLWDLSHFIFRSIYRFFKRRETDFLIHADHIISLTQAGKRAILARQDRVLSKAPITVIPCCVDFDHFRLAESRDRVAARETLGIPVDSKVVLYLGSVGTWYLIKEMFDFFVVYRSLYPNSIFLFVTRDDEEPIIEAAQARGMRDRLIIRSASRDEVPKFASAGDIGLFFIRPCFSKAASSPTKMGEILALGIPVLTNGDVGDVREIIESAGVGVVIDGFDDPSYRRAITLFSELYISPEEVRKRAFPWFNLNQGVLRYDSIYRKFLN